MDQDNHLNNRSKKQAPKGTAIEKSTAGCSKNNSKGLKKGGDSSKPKSKKPSKQVNSQI